MKRLRLAKMKQFFNTYRNDFLISLTALREIQKNDCYGMKCENYEQED